MNDSSAKEWLRKAWHNLSSAQLLYEAEHYTDTIAVELHYCLEKSLKEVLDFATQLFEDVLKKLDIDFGDIKE